MVKGKVYAVSGGPRQGVYTSWPQAVDAGFNQKQGYGNAVSFDGPEAAADAQQWVDGRKPYPEGTANQWRHGVKQQPFLVRLFVMVVLMTAFAATIAFIARRAEQYLGCRADYTRMADEVCLLVAKIDVAVRESAVSTTRLVATEVVVAIGLGFAWIFNILV
jgi:hypothetical protein